MKNKPTSSKGRSTSGKEETPFNKDFYGKRNENPVAKKTFIKKPKEETEDLFFYGDKDSEQEFKKNIRSEKPARASYGDQKDFKKPFEKKTSTYTRSAESGDKRSSFKKSDDKNVRDAKNSTYGTRPNRFSTDKDGFKPRSNDGESRSDGKYSRDSKTSSYGTKPNRFSTDKDGYKPRSNDGESRGDGKYSKDSKSSSYGTKPSRFSTDKDAFKSRNSETSDRENFKGYSDKPAPRKSIFDAKDKNDKAGNFGKPYTRKPYQKKEFSSDGPKKTKSAPKVDDGLIRLNKFIANAGICSRREADDLISAGAISVNGKVITELGYKVKPTDMVNYGGQGLKPEKMIYLLLNKPKDYLTTSDDPQDRRTVMSLIKDACKERLFSVGRLDRNTTGLLLLTNDGALTERITHPSYNQKKIYHVELDTPLSKEHFNAIKEGIELEDGKIKVDEIEYVTGTSNNSEIGITIHSGRNRIVRRIFEHFEYKIKKLDRVYFAGLTKKDLPRGRWRMLTTAEVNMLKMLN